MSIEKTVLGRLFALQAHGLSNPEAHTENHRYQEASRLFRGYL